MSAAIFVKEGEALSNLIVNQVFRLRHEAFIERLDWDIPSVNGMERDEFDDLKPYHIVAKNDDGSIAGCWRALPTTGKYMLKDVFPSLLQSESAPREKDVWEISRFTVRKNHKNLTKGYINSVTIDLISSFYSFAKDNNIRAFVTVTTVACERLLRQMGVSLRRMGDGNVVQIGKEKSVALWINVDDSLCIKMH